MRPVRVHRIDRRPLPDAESSGDLERFDPFDGYEAFVRRTLDLDALRAADLRILVDPLYGAGSAVTTCPRIDRVTVGYGPSS